MHATPAHDAPASGRLTGRPVGSQHRPSRQGHIGLEVQCTRCHDYWPADPDFFYPEGGSWSSWCRACYSEHTRARRLRAAVAAGAVAPSETPSSVPSTHLWSLPWPPNA